MISIIIPAYNVEDYIEQCVVSFLEQPVEDIEIIVVDDGSTDGTFDLCSAYEARDSRMRVLRQEHRTAGAARNLGMGSASGDYLLFFDADDYAADSFLPKMLARAEETGADVVHCRAYGFADVEGGGEEILEHWCPDGFDFSRVYKAAEYLPRLYQAFVGWSWDKLFRADLIRGRGLEFQDITSSNDAYFVFSALAEASTVAFVDEELVAHRKRRGSIETMRDPHNVKLAFDALLARTEEQGGSEPLRRSLLNWGLWHQRQNYYQFDGEKRLICVDDYYDVLDLCRAFEEDDFLYIGDKVMHQACIDGMGPRCEVIDLASRVQRFHDDADWFWGEIVTRDEQIARMREQIARQDALIAEKDGCIAGLADVIDELDAKFEEVVDSTTWRIGKIATAIPRALKDAKSKE